MNVETETEDFDNEILAYLSTRKQKLIDSHASYISEHPEMREILNDFLSSVLLNKPDDVYLFAKEYYHPFNPTPVKDKPFIVCGPFGVGKHTLRAKVLEQYGDLFDYVVSHTTRKQKPEEDSKEYHFVSPEQFDKMDKDKKFIETADSWGHRYGTSYQEIDRVKAEGKIPYIEVDFRGANGLKSIAANFVFLYPPSIEELRRRIANRTEDTEELFKKRMELAIKEIELANNAVLFTNRITNDVLDKAEQQLCTLIEALYFQELKEKRGENYEASAGSLSKKVQEMKMDMKEEILDMREEIKEYNEEKKQDKNYDLKEADKDVKIDGAAKKDDKKEDKKADAKKPEGNKDKTEADKKSDKDNKKPEESKTKTDEKKVEPKKEEEKEDKAK